MTPDGVKAAFGHELGHAFDHQSISDEIQHYNIAGREAFAELGRVVIQCNGDPSEVTGFLKRSTTHAGIFLPASRIIRYPDEGDKLQDAAFFHYLIQDRGLDEFTVFYANIPHFFGMLRICWELATAGFSVERVETRVFRQLDRWVKEESFLGGPSLANMLSLSQRAKDWYQR